MRRRAVLFVDVVGIDTVAGFVGQEGVKAVFERLVHERVSVGKKENFAGMIGVEEQVDQGDGGSCFAGPGRHNE